MHSHAANTGRVRIAADEAELQQLVYTITATLSRAGRLYVRGFPASALGIFSAASCQTKSDLHAPIRQRIMDGQECSAQGSPS